MNQNERDWSAVRAAVDARVQELRLSVAVPAPRARMSETIISAFRNGRSRPCGSTLSGLNEGPGLPRGYLHAVAERKKPEPPPVTTGARLARIEKKINELTSLVRNGPP
jgi:hypothetical protein